MDIKDIKQVSKQVNNKTQDIQIIIIIRDMEYLLF